MLKWLIYPCYCLICFFCVYKWIRHIDKKERKFLRQWEREYIESYKELWKEQYFLKLAEEKKIKEYQDYLKKEKQKMRAKLKLVKIEDINTYAHNFVQNLNLANLKLEKECEKV